MQKLKQFPDDFQGTAREWRILKRTELREALEALDRLRCGCFYTPAMAAIQNAIRSLQAAQEVMSQKEWGK